MKSEGLPVSKEKEIDELKASGECFEANLAFKIEDGVVTDIILWSIM